MGVPKRLFLTTNACYLTSQKSEDLKIHFRREKVKVKKKAEITKKAT
jgi:hypothetical protein